MSKRMQQCPKRYLVLCLCPLLLLALGVRLSLTDHHMEAAKGDVQMTTEAIATKATLEHHLSAFAQGIDAIMQDYSEKSVVITPDATYRGLDEIRAFFTAFVESLPEGLWDAFTIKRQEVVGEVAYILWEANPWFPLGTDTFVVQNGKIAYQTFAAYVHPSE